MTSRPRGATSRHAARDDVERRLAERIGERCGASLAGADRLDAAGIDSLEMAALVRELEREFDIRVDESIFDVETLRELARYVHERR